MSSLNHVVPRNSLLVSVQELAAANRPSWVLVDCRFNLLKPEAGQAAYLAGHIPGAWYADLDQDLSGPRGPGTGRHPLPEPQRLRALFGSFGITPGTRVVAYDEGGGGLAARLWWLLRWMGHRDVLLLDGGLAAWQSAGLPVSQVSPVPRQDVFEGAEGSMPVLGASAVWAALRSGSIRLLDVRAEERFLGRTEPIDPVAGHVPGAINVPFTGNLTTGQTFLSQAELAQRYTPHVAGWDPADVVCMCGSGVTACQGIFALALAGAPGVALYPGSWSEWIRSTDRPVATE